MKIMRIFETSCRKHWRQLAGFSLVMFLCNSAAPSAHAIASISAVSQRAIKHAKLLDATKHKLNGKKQQSIEGIFVQDAAGDTMQATNADVLFNPASTLKLATAWMSLHELGPRFTFETTVLADGVVTNGELQGNLYVLSDDLVFNTADAINVARDLNRRGIRSVHGKLIVSPGFHMNVVTNGKAAGKALTSALYPAKSNRALAATAPSVKIRGGVAVGLPKPTSNIIATHNSVPLKDILKAMLCFSNNYVADNLGTYVARRLAVDSKGQAINNGAKNLRHELVVNLGISEAEANFSSTSGLYKNRITPQAEMKVLRALQALLADNPLSPNDHLTLADILPVAGVDPGTLHKRFHDGAGSVIAKTGTLPDTDSGVTALVGEISTASDGNLLFVIFEQGVGRGSIGTYRLRQEQIVDRLQNAHGGARSFDYAAQPLVCHLGR